MVTFDGGSREVGRVRVTATGAAQWTAPDARGKRDQIAEAGVALPAEAHAQVAEAPGAAPGA
eukprot:9578142-Alexandrium_andersonii.AAC.1